jgi:pyruvyltransferase
MDQTVNGDLKSANPGRIHAFWCTIPSRPNFGDGLTPWLIRRLTGQYPHFVRPEDPRHKFMITGSIVGYAGANCSVWGCGILNRNDWISPSARLLAVRGPLTRERALQCGAKCPEVFGDPALLLPRLYRPHANVPRFIGGVIPHFSDMPQLSAMWTTSNELLLIDIQDSIEKTIDQIASCEFVLSSSLHGIIVSHAFGIPAVWVKFRDLPSGDDAKFHDYFHSIGQEPPAPVWLKPDQIDPDELAQRVSPALIELDLEALWHACPFRGSA